MSEDTIEYRDTRPDPDELSQAAAIVLSRPSWLRSAEEGGLDRVEIYRVLKDPGAAGQELNNFIERQKIPTKEEYDRARAAAYILQRLAMIQAELINDIGRCYRRMW